MTASVQAFRSGVSESCNALVNKAGNIAVGVGASAVVGYLIGGGTPGAWLAAKVASVILGALYAMDSSMFQDLSSLTHRTSHSAGNIAASVFIPFFLILSLQLMIH